jgi:hypothetical protein
MRWVFLLLLMLNGFYYVWHQQDAPLRPKEVAPLSLYRGAQQDIRLLSETGVDAPANKSAAEANQCLYIGGDISQDNARTIQQRLVSLDIGAQLVQRVNDQDGMTWLRVVPENRRLVDASLLALLVQDFPTLKSKIMSCEGIATID